MQFLHGNDVSDIRAFHFYFESAGKGGGATVLAERAGGQDDRFEEASGLHFDRMTKALRVSEGDEAGTGRHENESIIFVFCSPKRRFFGWARSREPLVGFERGRLGSLTGNE